MDMYQQALYGDLGAMETVAMANNKSVMAFLTPEVVTAVIGKFVAGDMSAEHIRSWADLLIFSDAFNVEGYENDAIADGMEWLWNIIHIIASPETEGVLTVERAKQFVHDIKCRLT